MSQIVIDHSDQHSIPTPIPAAEKPRTGKLGWLRTMTHHVPTILVLALLGGLGIYGHRTDWRMPKFAALVGEPPVVSDDWVRRTCRP